MGIQIGAKPDSGFDDPIGMLKDCHRRIEHFLELLCVVPGRAAGRVLTGEERSAVEAALSYFRVGGHRHTADEEQSLFPRMREGGAEADLAEVERLEHDHRAAEVLHESVEKLYSAWISNGRLASEDERELVRATGLLKQLYAKHIDVEETVVFPRAAVLLKDEAIAAMGQEFRARRM